MNGNWRPGNRNRMPHDAVSCSVGVDPFSDDVMSYFDEQEQAMPSSTLDPDFVPEPDRRLGSGHGIDALGPSDLSDTGSDVQGGLRAVEEDLLPLERGTNEDADSRNVPAGGDTDSAGTGERMTAGRNDDIEAAGDVGFDRIEHIDPADDLPFDELSAEDLNDITAEMLLPPDSAGEEVENDRRI